MIDKNLEIGAEIIMKCSYRALRMHTSLHGNVSS